METTFAAALLFLSGLALASAQGAAFTYQGRLTDGGNPAGGTYDLRFLVRQNSAAGYHARRFSLSA